MRWSTLRASLLTLWHFEWGIVKFNGRRQEWLPVELCGTSQWDKSSTEHTPVSDPWSGWVGDILSMMTFNFDSILLFDTAVGESRSTPPPHNINGLSDQLFESWWCLLFSSRCPSTQALYCPSQKRRTSSTSHIRCSRTLRWFWLSV